VQITLRDPIDRKTFFHEFVRDLKILCTVKLVIAIDCIDREHRNKVQELRPALFDAALTTVIFALYSLIQRLVVNSFYVAIGVSPGKNGEYCDLTTSTFTRILIAIFLF